MQKITISFVLLLTGLFGCKKSGSETDSVSLTASATQVLVGQKVSVTATTNANALSWSVNPAANVNKTYGITTEKINNFAFSQPGDYVISVKSAHLRLDSIHHCNPLDSLHAVSDNHWNHLVDSIWHQEGHHHGACRNGIDTAAITIRVI